jgi:ribosomal protein S18 acetylase RimI-like enzyme
MREILRVKTKSNKDEELKLKELDLSYLDEIMELQSTIVKGIENNEWYCAVSKEEFKSYFSEGKKVLGYLNEKNELVALGIYIKNGYDKENYGYDIGLEGEDLLEVAQIEVTIVLDEYRGNKLQRILCENIEEIAKKDNMKILAATASPYNIYSVKNFEDLGYHIEKDKIKYGGMRRYVLVKRI